MPFKLVYFQTECLNMLAHTPSVRNS